MKTTSLVLATLLVSVFSLKADVENLWYRLEQDGVSYFKFNRWGSDETSYRGVLNIYNQGEDKIRLDPYGSSWIDYRLGIGTKNPTERLDINGNLKLNGWIKSDDDLNFSTPGIALLKADIFRVRNDNSSAVINAFAANGNGSNSMLRLTTDTSFWEVMYNEPTQNLDFRYDNNPLMNLTPEGDLTLEGGLNISNSLGINTTTPTEALDINGNLKLNGSINSDQNLIFNLSNLTVFNTDTLRVTSDSGVATITAHARNGSGSNARLKLVTDTNTWDLRYNEGNQNLVFEYDYATKMNLNNDGDLTLYGDLNLSKSGNLWNIYTDDTTSDVLKFYLNNEPKQIIWKQGTTFYGNFLQIKGTDEHAALTAYTNAGFDSLVRLKSQTADWSMTYVDSTQNLDFRYSGESQLKLSNDGTLTAKKVVVTPEDWPDYVFETDYNLPKLTDVEDHIRTKKHLPEVPSAEKAEKDGVSLGEMQKVLLKKIEELTLYTIEQEKRIKALETQLMQK